MLQLKLYILFLFVIITSSSSGSVGSHFETEIVPFVQNVTVNFIKYAMLMDVYIIQ